MILGGLGTNFHVDLCAFVTETCCLAFLVASLWRPGGPWDDPGTFGSTRKDTLIFLLIQGRHFYSLLGTLDQKSVFLLPVSSLLFLVIFGSESGCQGFTKTSIWQRRYCKNQLSQKLDFSSFQGPFFMILGSLGTNFHDFSCPGDWLEIDDLSG